MKSEFKAAFIAVMANAGITYAQTPVESLEIEDNYPKIEQEANRAHDISTNESGYNTTTVDSKNVDLNFATEAAKYEAEISVNDTSKKYNDIDNGRNQETKIDIQAKNNKGDGNSIYVQNTDLETGLFEEGLGYSDNRKIHELKTREISGKKVFESSYINNPSVSRVVASETKYKAGVDIESADSINDGGNYSRGINTKELRVSDRGDDCYYEAKKLNNENYSQKEVRDNSVSKYKLRANNEKFIYVEKDEKDKIVGRVKKTNNKGKVVDRKISNIRANTIYNSGQNLADKETKNLLNKIGDAIEVPDEIRNRLTTEENEVVDDQMLDMKSVLPSNNRAELKDKLNENVQSAGQSIPLGEYFSNNYNVVVKQEAAKQQFNNDLNNIVIQEPKEVGESINNDQQKDLGINMGLIKSNLNNGR